MRVTTRATRRGPPPGNPGGRGLPPPARGRPSFSFSAKGKEESRGWEEGGSGGTRERRGSIGILRTDVTRLVAVDSRGRPAASDPYSRIEGREEEEKEEGRDIRGGDFRVIFTWPGFAI